MHDFPEHVPPRERLTRLKLYYGFSWCLVLVLVIGIWHQLGGFAASTAGLVMGLVLRCQARRDFARSRALGRGTDRK